MRTQSSSHGNGASLDRIIFHATMKCDQLRGVLIGARCHCREQFRFKDIVDLETGETVMELEHEIRSYQHTGQKLQAYPWSSSV